MIHKASVHFMWALMLLVLTLGAYGYVYSRVSARSVQANSVIQQIKNQNDASVKATLAKTQLAQLSTQQAAITQYFVSTSDVVPFIEKLQAIGKFVGANVQVVSVAAAPASPYGHLNLSVSITGTFDAVSRMLGAIEYQPYNTSINSLSLTAAAPSQASASTTPASSLMPVWNASVVFGVGAITTAATSTATTTP